MQISSLPQLHNGWRQVDDVTASTVIEAYGRRHRGAVILWLRQQPLLEVYFTEDDGRRRDFVRIKAAPGAQDQARCYALQTTLRDLLHANQPMNWTKLVDALYTADPGNRAALKRVGGVRKWLETLSWVRIDGMKETCCPTVSFATAPPPPPAKPLPPNDPLNTPQHLPRSEEEARERRRQQNHKRRGKYTVALETSRIPRDLVC